MVYEIGSLLRKCRNQKDQLCGRTKAWLYLIFCICIVFIFIRYRLLHIVDNLPFELYNNPFIIIGSVIIFILVSKLNIKSIAVNKLASFSFVVYLVHDEGDFARPLLCSFLRRLYEMVGNYYFILVLVYAIILYMLCCLLSYLFVSPIVNKINGVLTCCDMFGLIKSYLLKILRRFV